MKQFSFVTTIALLLALALPAGAQKPTITETPFTAFTLPSTPGFGTCSFDVFFAPQEGRPNGGKLIQFGHTAIGTGPIFVTATNLSNQQSVNLNISGPGTTTFTGGIPTTLVARGPLLIFALPTNVYTAAGLPAVALVHGQTTITFDTQGNITAVSFVGTVQDVCQMLE